MSETRTSQARPLPRTPAQERPVTWQRDKTLPYPACCQSGAVCARAGLLERCRRTCGPAPEQVAKCRAAPTQRQENTDDQS